MLMRRTDISDGLLFKSESMVGEERKWQDPYNQAPNQHISITPEIISSRRSSNGGFFYGLTVQGKGKKAKKSQFTASIDLFEKILRVKLDDSHIHGGNMQGREVVHEFDLRDILSAQ